DNNVLFALGLTVFAGLSTGIGSLMALTSKRFSPKFLSFALGLSAGVMVYVSLVEIFPKARESLELMYGAKNAYWFTILAFFIGMGIIALIDNLVPSYENPHELKNLQCDEKKKVPDNKKLMRMGMFSALAIAVHNFPEGLATFMAAMKDPTLGISIAVAIAIHNIPEGIAVSVPIYYATKSRSKAFFYSFLSGFAEPVGAILGYFILRNVMSEAAFGTIFAGVAGIMVYISLDELLPTAEEYGEHHIAISGLVLGMIIMAVSLVLFS
ncbi:MAG: zinc transporter ZupT, partial [Candidatus Cloacimonadaceae bacterium]|nr:zinc transporter ZupT [Candidatus Cloacimonadaceae bacterium]